MRRLGEFQTQSRKITLLFPEDQNQESHSHRVTSQIEFKEGSLYGFPDIPGVQAQGSNRNTKVGIVETIRVHKIERMDDN